MDRAETHPQKMVQRLLWAIGEGHRRGREEVVAEVPTEPKVAEMADTTIPAAIAAAVGLGAGRFSAPHTRLGLSVAIRGARVHLSLVGEVDWVTAPEFLDRMRALVDGGARSVVVDLGGAEFLDHAGLLALVSASTLLEEAKGEMLLKSPRSGTLEKLSRAGLSDRFIIC